MGKYQNKKQQKKQNNGVLIAAIIIIFVITLAAFVLFVMPQLLYNENAENPAAETVAAAQTEAQVSATEAAGASQNAETQAPVEEIFPLELEGGDLVVGSLFQFDGINPDAGKQEGTNIASIVLTNASGKYLSEATLALQLEDGTGLNFKVTDLPAGKSAMAFSVENASIEADAVCASWSCEASFDEAATAESQQVEVAVDGMTVTVTNVSGTDLSEIVIYCRCPFDEEYFGGITYEYTINDLPTGESTEILATDCILGMAEVVRIAIK